MPMLEISADAEYLCNLGSLSRLLWWRSRQGRNVLEEMEYRKPQDLKFLK
jgi:uncharacterized protein YjiS (DUF1127 family)